MKKVKMLLIIFSSLMLISCGFKNQTEEENVTQSKNNSNNEMVTQNEEALVYTWEEFCELTSTEQMQFQNSFENMEKFNEWIQKAQEINDNYSWKNEGKQRVEYTWEDFEALAPNEQIKFQNSFSSIEEFDRWMQNVQGNIEDFSWNDENGQPLDYTWEEFENLEPADQIKFQNSFESFEKFDEWLQKAQGGV